MAAVVAVAAVAAAPTPPAPVANWAINSIALSDAATGGPVRLDQLGQAADRLSAALPPGAAAARFTAHGVVSLRLEVRGVPPALVDAAVGAGVGGGAPGEDGGASVDSESLALPNEEEEEADPGAPRAAALAAYAGLAVASVLPDGVRPQVYLGRAPMPESLLSWRLSDGRGSPDPAAWPPSPGHGGSWPTGGGGGGGEGAAVGAAGGGPAAAGSPAAPPSPGARRRRLFVASSSAPARGGLARGRRALRQQPPQPLPANKRGGSNQTQAPTPPVAAAAAAAAPPVPLYVTYYGLSPSQAAAVASLLGRTCPPQPPISPDGRGAASPPPPPTITGACETALGPAASLLLAPLADKEDAADAAVKTAAAPRPRLSVADRAVARTFLTTAVPLTDAQVKGGGAALTDRFFGDAAGLQAEVAPAGTRVSTLRPQQFFGSYVPAATAAAAAAGASCGGRSC